MAKRMPRHGASDTRAYVRLDKSLKKCRIAAGAKDGE
jgi:hypothetical protein